MSSTSTALVATPVKTASNAVVSSARTATDLITQTAKTAQSIVSTPQRSAFSTPNTALAPPPSPGTFRHPRLTEIIARQSKNTFTERNVRNTVVNVAALVFSLAFGGTIHSSITALLRFASVPDATSITSVVVLLLRLVLLANTVLSLRPVIPYISTKDEVTDIPLTPSQRSLLGLDPSVQSTPASANTTAPGGFITPPRYRRSSGSISPSLQSLDRPSTDRRSISANYSSSPLSTSRYTVGFSPSPAAPSSFRRTASGSPFSPSPTASPLLHKAVTQSQSQIQPYTQDLEFNVSRSTSVFGASTGSIGGLGRSQSVHERGVHERRHSDRDIGSPTPAKRSPGLNYKWLYDKGGRLPRSESIGF